MVTLTRVRERPNRNAHPFHRIEYFDLGRRPHVFHVACVPVTRSASPTANDEHMAGWKERGAVADTVLRQRNGRRPFATN